MKWTQPRLQGPAAANLLGCDPTDRVSMVLARTLHAKGAK
jgi:hypothetical protein